MASADRTVPDATEFINERLRTDFTPLAGVVTAPNIDLLGEDGKYRLYGASVSTTTNIDNIRHSDAKTIVYRVGVKAKTCGGALRILQEARSSTLSVGQSFTVNEAVSNEISGINRRYSSYVTKMDKADFSAMVEYLAASLAAYGAYGSLSADDMRAGSVLQLRSLAVLDNPVAANANCVFIPRSVSTSYSPGAFSALVIAANAVGSSVVSDVVLLDGNTNAPKVELYENADLAIGCYQAVRMLLSIMEASNAGALGAYAFTRGVHKVLTVVGHTDEGGYLRDVLRRGAFAPSYGGVYPGEFMSYHGLPTPSAYNRNTFSCLMDGIALATAGLAAVCDPLCVLDGRRYPTVVSTGVCTKGKSTVLRDERDAIQIEKKIFDVSGRFSQIYCDELAKLFLLNNGCSNLAAQHLTWCFGIIGPKPSRHSQFTSVAPFYWVEPTSLFKEYSNTDAVREGYATLCCPFKEGAVKYFEKVTVLDPGSSVSQAVVSYKSARTCGFVLHHYENKLDGTASLIIRQADVTAFVHRGGVDEDVNESLDNHRPLDAYLWKRGDGGLPAPSELLYTGGTLGVVLQHSGFNFESCKLERTYIKSATELVENQEVILQCVTPSYVGLGTIGNRTRAQKRARTCAAERLEHTRLLVGGRAATGGETLAVAYTAPSLAHHVAEVTAQDKIGASIEVMSASIVGRGGVTRRGPPAGTFVEQLTVRPVRQQIVTEAPQVKSGGPGSKEMAEKGEMIHQSYADAAAGHETVEPAPPAT